jgi:hypothetical protein
MSDISKTLAGISALSDQELLDRYLGFSLQSGEPDLTDRLLIGLLRAEWNKRHPEDPMPDKAERKTLPS